jgi:HSP20 family protein
MDERSNRYGARSNTNVEVEDTEYYEDDEDEKSYGPQQSPITHQSYNYGPQPQQLNNSRNDYTDNSSSFNNNWLPKTEHGGELSVDVYELDDEIIVQAMIAGVRPEDLDIDVTREMIVIEGHREGPQGVPDNNYYHQELFWGAFNRTIMLPDEIEVEEAEASESHGLLTLRLPKLDKARSTKLKVRSRT